MGTHTAKSLFDLNIQSAEDLLRLYDGIIKLKSKLDTKWILRAVVVFSVAVLDAYFHDKIKYKAGKFSLHDMPPALAGFEVPLRDLVKWEEAERKGNVIRNWLTDRLSYQPLQRKDDIAKALKLVGIESVWSTIEPDENKRDSLISDMHDLIQRRNQISHEGDRQSSRRSGKELRPINRSYASWSVDFVKKLVGKIENAFPN